MDARQYVTTEGAVELLREHGYPITHSHFTKLNIKSSLDKPPVAGRWGRYKLYEPSALLEWAASRVRPAEEAA